MSICVPHYVSIKVSELNRHKRLNSFCSLRRDFRVFAVASTANEAWNYIPAAPIFLPEGSWKQIPGGVTAAKGFNAAGMYGGLRAKGEKPDLALVTCDVDAISAGAFTTNVVAAAPVIYCKKALDFTPTARAVLINAGQANAATGDAGYQDVIESSSALAKLLQLKPEEVLIESTGVIGQRIKKEALLNSLPKLVNLLSPTIEGADSAAVAITTTDLVSKSVAIESEVGGTRIRVGGMAKGSGMIHPNMATMLGVITTDALVTSTVWRKMVQVAVNRSFNQITVDGDTSTNDAVIALASGLSGSNKISSLNSSEAKQLQECLDAVMQGLAKSIAWDGEGATCLIEVTVTGASCEAEAAKIARSVASSSLTKAAVYGRDPNWGRIACAAGYAGIPFEASKLRISLGDILLMDGGQPLPFDRAVASNYLRKAGETHGTVKIQISIGDGPGSGLAWGCDLSYDYVKINAEYTTCTLSSHNYFAVHNSNSYKVVTYFRVH
ncbi:Arginine biosynthesis bifunctional protein ArgJ beta chain like [Actinidia chinensis var. chinensis]|uniref:Arginine biosynthesis bifunctional protein ArgJ, chloroplastic n=1 Tax=Actinidia chinensis var. chinensis TaxID=1590841 RepID=A0A2R6QKG6_ACTCC|nr:Arginine biosynthesis bifunctional protein ArgJ beta chain like [Actinidia chinensis var. chinensis]